MCNRENKKISFENLFFKNIGYWMYIKISFIKYRIFKLRLLFGFL